MSTKPVMRKVKEWHEVPRTWTCTLECGHDPYGYEPVSDDTKEIIEKEGEVGCYECGREEDRISDLEGQLRALKSKRRSPT